MPSSKTLGKLKVGSLRSRAEPVSQTVARGDATAHGDTTQPTALRLGGLKVVARPCEQCEGLFAEGMWIHSARCPNTVLLYFAHQFRASDWTGGVYGSCPWKCPGEIMGDCVTHSWQCPFWNTTERTPF